MKECVKWLWRKSTILKIKYSLPNKVIQLNDSQKEEDEDRWLNRQKWEAKKPEVSHRHAWILPSAREDAATY